MSSTAVKEVRSSTNEAMCDLLCLPQGKLPYTAGGQLFSVRPVVYECCPDWDCPDGDACPYVRSVGRLCLSIACAQTGTASTATSAPTCAWLRAPHGGRLYVMSSHMLASAQVLQRDWCQPASCRRG